MPTTVPMELLAQLPESYLFVSPWKLIVAVVLFTLWALLAQWVDRDTEAVNTFRVVWNVVAMICGIAAVALLLFLPAFLAGVAAFVLINLVFGIIYVVHRNGLVVEDDKVCTAAHFKRIMREGFSKDKKKEKRHVSERVRITGANRKVVGIPEEDPEREQFGLSQDLLFDALWRHASYVEVIPAGQASKTRVTVDGVAGEREPLTRPEGRRHPDLLQEGRWPEPRGTPQAAAGADHGGAGR